MTIMLAAMAFATQVVSAAMLSATAAPVVARVCADATRGVVASNPLSDQRVPAGHLRLVAQAPMRTPDFAELPIAIYVDKTLVRTVYAGYRIVTYVEAPVLRAALRAGHVLTAEDFTTARIIADGRSSVSADNLIGRKLNADSPAAHAVRPEETSVEQIVRAGSPVVLIVHDGEIALAADVLARTSGGIGETVTVYDDRARKMLSGIVTAPSRVELTLPEVQAQ